MDTLLVVFQLIVALGLLNVWLLRFSRKTDYRGGDATNMKEEFQAYGLPDWSMMAVGFLKVALAILLIAGIWLPVLTRPVAAGIAVLMAGAILMHVRIKDPAKKSLPAGLLLVLTLAIAVL